MTEINSELILIVSTIIAPILTAIIAKFRNQFTNIKKLITEIDTALEDDKLTPTEIKGIAKLLKGMIK